MKTKSLLLFALAAVSLAALADDPITKLYDLPYIVGQGATSGVDNWGSSVPTERTLTDKSVVELEVEMVSTNYTKTVFCNRVNASSKNYTLFFIKDQGWRFDYNNSSAAVYGGMPEIGKRYKLKLSPEGLWVDGVKTIEKTPATFEIPTKLSIASCYTYDTSKGTYSYSTSNRGMVKIYSFKVSEPDEGGDLQTVFELKPCYASNGKVGLEDSGTKAVYCSDSAIAPLASLFTVKASDGTAGILKAFADAKSASLNGSGVAYYGYQFAVALEPGVYDLTDATADSNSHLKIEYGKDGWLIGLGKTPADVVLKGLGEADTRRVLNAGSATVTNLTVTGGHLTASTYGGGVLTSSAGVGGLLSCIVTNNYAAGGNGNGGGGVWGFKVVRNCLIADNKSNYGGGLRSCNEVVDCVISNNFATGSGGGASGIVARRCHFFDNDAYYHGGGATESVLTDCVLIGNRCRVNGSYGDGGGLNIGAATNCTFVGNSDSGANGSYGSVASEARIVGCTVTNSTARCWLFNACSVERTYIAHCGAASDADANSFAVFGRSLGSGSWNVVNTIVENIVCSNANDRVSRYHNLINCTVRNVQGKTYGPIDASASAVNTIIADCTPYDVTASRNGALTNCLYKTSSGEFAEGRLVDCHQVASVRWSKEGGPYLCDIRASSKAFNRGLETDDILALVGETDKAGRPRVMFGKIDIGALECQDDTLPGLMLLVQ